MSRADVSWWLRLASVLAAGGLGAATDEPVVRMLVPGFTVQELPVKLSNQNNLRFAPDGTLTSLGYDGRVWRLIDTDGDGLEDVAEPFWDRPTLSVPLGMAWSTDGLYVSSHGKVSRLRDTDGDGRADEETVVASGWPATDVASGGVDATAVTLDSAGNLYFGLLGADYSNAYRLRKRSDLKPEEVAWLKQQGRWREPEGDNAANDEFSLYDLNSKRGTIQKFDPRTKQLETIATGIRVPVALAFNQAGDLFNTDQEGETWMPNGNPLDELNHIVPGRNYGFPPRHERWLPDLVSEPPVVAFGPQHQSSCGLVFNEPHGPLNLGDTFRSSDPALPAAPAQASFGPKWWEGDAFVAGESRGKIWRVRLVKTPQGYVGKPYTIARLSMLALDLAISPRGELYVCCHSGPPDWGTGPQGEGRIFKITYTDPKSPQPVAVWPDSPTEVRVAFDRPLDPGVTNAVAVTQASQLSSGDSTVPKSIPPSIEFGEYVSAGDRFEVLKPPYEVVQQQDATPRGHLAIRAARLEGEGRTLVLTTDPHPLAVNYAVTIPQVMEQDAVGVGSTVDLAYDFKRGSAGPSAQWAEMGIKGMSNLTSWAPTNRASFGTDSRAARKPDGDWENGRTLFADKLQCAKCHRLRGDGATVGPDLSNLAHRDTASVLRDIRDPGATLHPDYVTYQADLKNGDTAVGFLRGQSVDSIRLVDVAGQETVFPRNEVTNLHPTGQSLMPTGLLDGLKDTDVRDLLTFLLWEPPARTRAEVERSFSKRKSESENRKPVRLVLVASKQDHGPGQHDYPAWQEKWVRLLQSVATNTRVEKAWEWPSADQFASADVLVFYYWNHDWSAARLAEIDAFQQRGGGIVLLHSATIADTEPERLAERFGLASQPGRTGYWHMPFELKILAEDHPLTRGLPDRLAFLDEPYWPMVGDPALVTVLAAAEVDGAARPLIWTFEHGRGRVFGSIPGHYFWTLDDPLFRLLVLRGIAWAAGADLDSLTAMATTEAVIR